MKTGLKVSEAMSKFPVFVDLNLSITECANSMLKNKVGSAIVKEKDKILGIITEKDIVKGIAKKIDLEKTKVQDLMSRKLLSIDPDKDLYEAMNYMRKKDVRRLPVMHNGKLLGLLTEKDILRIEPQLFDVLLEKYRIQSPTTRNPDKYTEGECESCGNYAQLYQNNKGALVCIRCLDQESK